MQSVERLAGNNTIKKESFHFSTSSQKSNKSNQQPHFSLSMSFYKCLGARIYAFEKFALSNFIFLNYYQKPHTGLKALPS